MGRVLGREYQADSSGCLLFDYAVVVPSSLLDGAFSTVCLLELTASVADGVLEACIPEVGEEQELVSLLDYADLIGCVGDVDRVMAFSEVFLGDAFWQWIPVGLDQASVPSVFTLILTEFETKALTCLFEAVQVCDLDFNLRDV